MCVSVYKMCDNLDEELRQLIEILSTALQCGNLTVHQIDLTKNVQGFLTNVLTTLLKPIIANARGNQDSQNNDKPPSILNILTPFAKLNFSPTTTEDSIGTPSTVIPDSFNFSTSGVMTTASTTPSTTLSTPRLHRLEIIKVIVLIVVISIILVSTCRMVFQLFVRFRPSEKTEYHQG